MVMQMVMMTICGHAAASNDDDDGNAITRGAKAREETERERRGGAVGGSGTRGCGFKPRTHNHRMAGTNE
eukprot:9273095-Pyramimonas_sp.AAC.1